MVLRSQSLYCSLPPRPRRWSCLCRDVDWTSITETDVDLRRRRPSLVTTPYESSNFLSLGQSSCWFPVVLSVLRRTVHCTLRVLNHFSCGFNFNFYWKFASKATDISNAAYSLRVKTHSKALIDKTTDLNEHNFLIGVLYKDCY